jgi:hypothetical protein
MSGVRLSVGPRVARIILVPTKLAGRWSASTSYPKNSRLFTSLHINAISKDSSKLYLESLCSATASGHSAGFISGVSLHTILLHQLLGPSIKHI